MLTQNLGYPRIGNRRELKKACEKYWAGKITLAELIQVGKEIRSHNWKLQKEIGIDLIPSNDFSFYDQVLDTSFMLGAIPERFQSMKKIHSEYAPLDTYFAMARGYQDDQVDLTAMEMTKWFDTNYHYIVPEFYPGQCFSLTHNKIIEEFEEALSIGIKTKPVLIGPISYLLLGKTKIEHFNPLELIENLLPVYHEIFQQLEKLGAEWIQLDEPFLALDPTDDLQELYQQVYQELSHQHPTLQLMLATYFEGLGANTPWVSTLPVAAIHIDVVRDSQQLPAVLSAWPKEKMLSVGVVDGRNIWKNDFKSSLALLHTVVEKIGIDTIIVSPSCSLLHAPCDLALEDEEAVLTPEIKNWLSFSKQKLAEVRTLAHLLSLPQKERLAHPQYLANQEAIESRRTAKSIHDEEVTKRVHALEETHMQRAHPFPVRREVQKDRFKFPLFPTTTIGSFPQTRDIRKLRAQWRKGEIAEAEYTGAIQQATIEAIRLQEEMGLEVLVHGEFERNDMVEYFGEMLNGFTFTRHAWVQSYGSRCVKPPIIFGDVSRRKDMTVEWSTYAQSQTHRPVKGMLTGPITILQWSFVRDDQSREETCMQLALAMRDEVQALERAGISIIQIDEPAFREGLPLKMEKWESYLSWAVKAFRISSCGVKDETQIHTHMCYSEFNDIIEDIAALDADVITIETSRSEMELLDAFVNFDYPNEIGPGVYDIHSPRVPSVAEMEQLLHKAIQVLPLQHIWVNPDCGLKTRKWPETEKALRNMVEAARSVRASVREKAQ